jgi:hypothetical protein
MSVVICCEFLCIPQVFLGFAFLGTALVASSGVTWRRFTCIAAWVNEVNMNFAVMSESDILSGQATEFWSEAFRRVGHWNRRLSTRHIEQWQEMFVFYL